MPLVPTLWVGRALGGLNAFNAIVAERSYEVGEKSGVITRRAARFVRYLPVPAVVVKEVLEGDARKVAAIELPLEVIEVANVFFDSTHATSDHRLAVWFLGDSVWHVAPFEEPPLHASDNLFFSTLALIFVVAVVGLNAGLVNVGVEVPALRTITLPANPDVVLTNVDELPFPAQSVLARCRQTRSLFQLLDTQLLRTTLT